MSRIEDNVCVKIQERAKVGFKKYGKTMEREDFSLLDWYKYLQEELMDAIVYIERIMEDLSIEETTSKLMGMGEYSPLVEPKKDKKKKIGDVLKRYRERLNHDRG